MEDLVDWVKDLAEMVNDNSGLVQAILVLALAGATLYYARTTKDIASETRRQAEASVKMVDEMRRQRLAVSQPLLIPIVDQHPAYASGQTNFSWKIRNVGNGPAVDVRYVVTHPWLWGRIETDARVTLLVDEPWDLAMVFRESGTSHGTNEPQTEGNLTVQWRDIHDNKFMWSGRLTVQNQDDRLWGVLLEDIRLCSCEEDVVP